MADHKGSLLDSMSTQCNYQKSSVSSEAKYKIYFADVCLAAKFVKQTRQKRNNYLVMIMPFSTSEPSQGFLIF